MGDNHLPPNWSTSPARSFQVRISHWSKSPTFPRQRKQVVRARKSNFRLSNKILDLPEITRKQLPIGFSVRCARARADAFCSLRARLYPPLWCCALVQDPHDTAGGDYPPRIRRVGPAGSLFQQVICIRCDKSFLSLSLFLQGGWVERKIPGRRRLAAPQGLRWPSLFSVQ